MTSTKCLNSTIIFFSLIGIGLSCYAFYVETRLESDPKYVALCDINEQMSCSKVYNSKYGKGFGLVAQYLGEKHPLNQPNGLAGVVVYSVIALLSMVNSRIVSKLQILICFITNIASVHLAYVMYIILKNICVVCVSIYVINFVCFVLAIYKHRVLATGTSKSARSKSSKKKKSN